jgi:hypothetical protein
MLGMSGTPALLMMCYQNGVNRHMAPIERSISPRIITNTFRGRHDRVRREIGQRRLEARSREEAADCHGKSIIVTSVITMMLPSRRARIAAASGRATWPLPG